MSFQIRILTGPDVGKVFPLPRDKAALLGRGKEADVQLNDPGVSRAHCQIHVEAGQAYIYDLASRSGIVLNGERVTEHPLSLQDVVKIGATEFQLEAVSQVKPGDLAEQSTLYPGQINPRVAVQPGLVPPTNPLQNPPVTPLSPAMPVTQAKIGSPAPQAKPAVPARGDKPPPLPAERMAALTGYRLGAFLIGPMLAHGLSGPVFQATDISENRPAALKVLWPEFSLDDDDVQRFVRTMKTMLPIRHPHLVAIYGAGKTARYCWIAMEFVKGDSLAQVMLNKPGQRLDWKEALRVGVHVSRALVYAHHHHIIHRNITPRNILLTSNEGIVKLGDLMLGKALEGSLAKNITAQGELLGDLQYLSPERTSGLTSGVDERSDIYSLGATLYAALTGKPPSKGKSMMETILKIRQENPAPLRTVQSGTPAEFEQVVMKMLAKAPKDRYQKAADVLGVLRLFAKSQGVEV